MKISSEAAKREFRKLQEKKTKTNDLILPDTFSEGSRLLTIDSPSGFVPMELFDYQKVIDEKLREQELIDATKNRWAFRWNKCHFVKSRQSAITSITAFRCLFEALKTPGFNTLFFEPSEALVKVLSAKVRYAASLLPGKQLLIDNVSEVKLKNQSTLFFRTGKAENASRGIPIVRRICIDEEIAYGTRVGGGDRLKSLISEVAGAATLVSDKLITYHISTPNVPTDYYTQLLIDLVGSFDKLQQIAVDVSEHKLVCKEGIPGFYYLEFPKQRSIIFFVHFSCHPQFRGCNIQKQLELFQETSGQTWDEVLREYHLRWLLESYSQVISDEIIESQATGEYEEENDNQSYYFAGLDPSGYSENNKSDYCSMSILKLRGNRFDLVNDEIYDNESEIPKKIAKVIRVLKRYKITKLAIETNGVGITYCQEIERQLTDSGYFCDIFKIHNSTNKRIQLTSQLQLQLELGNLFYPRDSHIHKELPELLRDSRGRITHGLHSHDDACFSTAIALSYALSPEELAKRNKQEERKETQKIRKIKKVK